MNDLQDLDALESHPTSYHKDEDKPKFLFSFDPRYISHWLLAGVIIFAIVTIGPIAVKTFGYLWAGIGDGIN